MKALFIVILFISFSASSQISIWPKAGANLSWSTYTEQSSFVPNYNHESSYGFSGGVAINIQVTKFLSIRPEIMYNTLNVSYGYNYSISTGSSRITANYQHSENRKYISLPISFVGHLAVGKGEVLINLGGYASIGLEGNFNDSFQQVTTDSQGGISRISVTNTGFLAAKNVPANSPFAQAFYNKMDYGIISGLGYQLDRTLIMIQFNSGLTNTQPHYDDPTYENSRDNRVTNNRSILLQLGFRLF